jgi:hypothetical protein
VVGPASADLTLAHPFFWRPPLEHTLICWVLIRSGNGRRQATGNRREMTNNLPATPLRPYADTFLSRPVEKSLNIPNTQWTDIHRGLGNAVPLRHRILETDAIILAMMAVAHGLSSAEIVRRG